MDRPVKPNIGSTPEEIEEYVKWLDSVGGLASEKTLRDDFAEGADISHDFIMLYIEKNDKNKNPTIEEFFETKAMIRYYEADAMLKERNK